MRTCSHGITHHSFRTTFQQQIYARKWRNSHTITESTPESKQINSNHTFALSLFFAATNAMHDGLFIHVKL